MDLHVRKITITTQSGNKITFHAELVNSLPSNLAELDKSILYLNEKETSILFELTDSDKCFQIISLGENKIESVAVLIGHKVKVFRQFICGQRILIVPLDKRKKKVESNSIYTVR